MTPEHYPVLIVGAGPAGLAAARAAASHGARVGLIDAQPRAGGQVWRHDVAHGSPRAARARLRAIDDMPHVHLLCATRVVAVADRALLLETADGARWVHHDALVLATGARERLLPFPGWTLPGVTGAGGLQALAKQGWPVRGKRVVVAGSGPLLLATAATLRRHGAHVLGVYEQLDARRRRRFAAGLWRWPGKLAQALALRARLLDTPMPAGQSLVRAQGGNCLQSVEIRDARGTRHIDCDLLAVGYGLVPNLELAQSLDCDLQADTDAPRVHVDSLQRSSVEGVFAAGEICGIGGRDCAPLEGAIAGHMAAGAEAAARALRSRAARARGFASHLERHFRLDPAFWRERLQADTLICRCENVPWSALAEATDARGAKLATRCGMGACQGRICGHALTTLRGLTGPASRPPLFPARLDTLATADPYPPLPSQPAATILENGVNP